MFIAGGFAPSLGACCAGTAVVVGSWVVFAPLSVGGAGTFGAWLPARCPLGTVVGTLLDCSPVSLIAGK